MAGKNMAIYGIVFGLTAIARIMVDGVRGVTPVTLFTVTGIDYQ
jgi:hypothetical protein